MVGCSFEPTKKVIPFKFGDRVKIVSGFYQGCVGTVLTYAEGLGSHGVSVTECDSVEFEKTVPMLVAVGDLRIVRVKQVK